MAPYTSSRPAPPGLIFGVAPTTITSHTRARWSDEDNLLFEDFVQSSAYIQAVVKSRANIAPLLRGLGLNNLRGLKNTTGDAVSDIVERKVRKKLYNVAMSLDNNTISAAESSTAASDITSSARSSLSSTAPSTSVSSLASLPSTPKGPPRADPFTPPTSGLSSSRWAYTAVPRIGTSSVPVFTPTPGLKPSPVIIRGQGPGQGYKSRASSIAELENVFLDTPAQLSPAARVSTPNTDARPLALNISRTLSGPTATDNTYVLASQRNSATSNTHISDHSTAPEHTITDLLARLQLSEVRCKRLESEKAAIKAEKVAIEAENEELELENQMLRDQKESLERRLQRGRD